MIANIGPADCNYDETLSTLRYAHRAKNIRNKPRLNDDPKDAMLRAFQEEISKLRAELAIASSKMHQHKSADLRCYGFGVLAVQQCLERILAWYYATTVGLQASLLRSIASCTPC